MQTPDEVDLIDFDSPPRASTKTTPLPKQKQNATAWETCLAESKDTTRYPLVPVIDGPFQGFDDMLYAKADGNYNVGTYFLSYPFTQDTSHTLPFLLPLITVFSLPLTFTPPHIHSPSHSLPLTFTSPHIHSPSHSLPLTFTPSHIHSLSHSLPFTFTPPHIHSLSHSLPLTFTPPHIHSPTNSPSPQSKPLPPPHRPNPRTHHPPPKPPLAGQTHRRNRRLPRRHIPASHGRMERWNGV